MRFWAVIIMDKYLRRAWVEVDLDKLEANFLNLKKHLPQNVQIMVIVKANANGIGDVAVAELLDKQENVCFGVSNIEEAITIRKTGTKKEILILGYTPVETAGYLYEYDITQSIFSHEYGLELEKECGKINAAIKVNLKLDTGMGRIGIVCHGDLLGDSLDKCAYLVNSKYFTVTGTFTHVSTFYELDENSEKYSEFQFSNFMTFIEEAEKRDLNLGLKHCCNSPGAVNHPEMALDMVRVGTFIFGGLTDEYKKIDID